MKPIVIVPPLLVLALAPAAVSLVLLLLPLDEHAVTRTAAHITALLLIQILRLATEPLSLPGGPYRYDLAVLSQPSGAGDQPSPVYSRAAPTVFPQPSC